jgi:hypothetical protein
MLHSRKSKLPNRKLYPQFTLDERGLLVFRTFLTPDM